MKARELIEDLGKLDPEMEVLVTDTDGILGELQIDRTEVDPNLGFCFLITKE